MAGLNKVLLLGNLGKDPDLRRTQNGDSVANFSIATSEKFNTKDGQAKETTEWHQVVAYGKLADLAGQYLKKGRKALIEGKLQTRKWTDKQNIERYVTEIVASNVVFVDSNGGGNSQPRDTTRDYNHEPDVPF